MYLEALCLLFGFWSTLSLGENVPVITTEQGKLSGISEEAYDGTPFNSYYAIPFAQPPLGELRFKDPQPPSTWTGVRKRSSLASPCVQVPFGHMLAGVKLPPEELVGDEDCLYLNVFTPKGAQTRDDIPVMVYIHGGGFFAGGAFEYLPHVLLSRDIILVVIQYRLGFLGFLSTEDSIIPGNYGLKDQIAALQWVQKNIKHFGGNPKKVTIFGESAGAASVHYHMFSPKSEGLFSGAIMESGNALDPWALRGAHRKSAEALGSKFGCSVDGGSQAFLSCLQSVDAKKINYLGQEFSVWFAFPMLATPRIDGDIIPDHPAQLMKEGRYHKVNIMAGVTADEGAIFTHPMYVRPDLIHALENDFAVNGPASLAWYETDTNQLELSRKVYNYYLGGVDLGLPNSDYVTQMFSDVHFNWGFDLVSQYHAQNKEVSFYRYELTHRGQLSTGDLVFSEVGKHWVCHGDELYYLFRGGPLLSPEIAPPGRPKDLQSPEDLAVRRLMLTLWTNFASTGHPDPDNKTGANWTPTSSKNLRHLSILPSSVMAGDSRKEVRAFFSTLPTEINRILHPHLIKEDENASSTGSQRMVKLEGEL